MVAHPDRARVLTAAGDRLRRPRPLSRPRPQPRGRHHQDRARLATGAVSILSDGFHSLTDSASNIVALVGVSIARRPPDENHPYGHRKYETMASLGILIFLIIVLVQVLSCRVRPLRQRRHAAGVP